MLACHIHLENNREAVDYINKLLAGAWDWKAEPMKIIGQDEAGHCVCCVAHGRHGPMYHRAMTGISDLFTLEIRIIDVDTIINEKASFHLWMATCLDIIKCQGVFWQTHQQEFFTILRTHIAGSR